MIIKITPENDIEKTKIKEVEHTGVKEFFIFGNKLDADGHLIDFHDYSGSYRYLEGSCYYFLGRIRNEQDSKNVQETQVNVRAATSTPPSQPMIKTGAPRDGKIEGVVEVGKPPLRFAKGPVEDAVIEDVVQEDTAEEDATVQDDTVVEDNQETTD